jgi:hypothetical protein
MWSPALKKLRSKGYRLAILSNGDRDMLEAAGPAARAAILYMRGCARAHLRGRVTVNHVLYC